MYSRTLSPPGHSFFLFGPRSTGKTTLLREHLAKAAWFNLLIEEDYLSLLSNHELLQARVEALPGGSWVVIDEVQRIPALLNRVHDLISRHGQRYRFALSGSSARKLRRLDVNLLAGRVIERRLFPLTAKELGSDFDLNAALRFGTLPNVAADIDYRTDILRTYVNTYLREEIQQEALVKDLASFHRFLKVAALMHGCCLNIAGIARDAAVARTSVHRYFQTLIDTLVGVYVPAWQPRAKIRERASSKFYFFDCGVVRAINGIADEPLHESEIGALLEGYLLHELRAADSYQNLGGEIFYWATASSKEVDFIWSKGRRQIGIEVKAAQKWRPEYAAPLNELIEAKHLNAGYVVYRGKEVLKQGKVTVLPVRQFLSRLYEPDFWQAPR